MAPATTVRVGTVVAILIAHIALLWVWVSLRSEHRAVQVASEMKATFITLSTQMSVPTAVAPVLSPVSLPTVSEELPDFEVEEVRFQHPSSLRQIAIRTRGHRVPSDSRQDADRVVLPRKDPQAPRPSIQRFSPPRSARASTITRTVRVAIFVQPDGKIGDVTLEGSSGDAAVDLAALEYVQTWKFIAGSRNGIPQAMWVSETVVFPIN